MVLKPSAALPIRLDGGGYRGFPGSLMGQIAYVRQLFLDADHYAVAWADYEAAPTGVERPHYDRSLEPLVRAKAEGWPVLIPAAWSKEIVRAIRLGEQLGVHAIIEGAHQGYAAIDVLKEAGVPVLVSVDWPERSKDADPDEVDPLRVLDMRDRAPSTPAALHLAGIPFALVSGDAKDPSDVLAGVRKAIEAGLPADAALRALTLTPAELFGVDDRLGSLEPGKIANLVVTEGELFDEKAKVRHVFVDGRLFSLPAKDEEEDEGDDGDGKTKKKRRPGNAAWAEAFGDAIYDHDHGHDHGHPHGEDIR
jgi:imidazolonepropionase-like amidohydrolase